LHGKLGEKGKGEFSTVFQVSGQQATKSISHEQYQELMKAVKKLDASDKTESFTGISYYLMNSISKNAWIIDSSASDHIICNEGFLSNIKKLHFPILVQLLN